MLKLRTHLFTFLIVAILPSISSGQIQGSDCHPTARFRFQSNANGLYGYFDQTGRVVIAPQFQEAGQFLDCRAKVQTNHKIGYIDLQGELVVKADFDAPGDFAEGRAPVWIEGKGAYIDPSGVVVIKPQFTSLGSFGEGLAPVQIDKKFGYIDRFGNWVIDPQFDYASTFSEGLAQVFVGDLYGYIDRSGQFVIKPQFEMSDSPYANESVHAHKRHALSENRFSGGYAVVNIKGLFGYIDKVGSVVVSPQFTIAFDFAEGLAAVATGNAKDTKFGYIDNVGRFVIPQRFHEVGDFAGGLAWVQDIRDGMYRFITPNGEQSIQRHFDGAESFVGGLAQVTLKRTKLKYEWFSGDKSGRYYVKEPYAFINSSGQTVFSAFKLILINPTYTGSDETPPPLVDVHLNSAPPNATVYLVPLIDVEFNKGLLSDDAKLAAYIVADGNTPVRPRVYMQVYVVVFILNGKRVERRLDANPKGTNLVSVEIK